MCSKVRDDFQRVGVLSRHPMPILHVNKSRYSRHKLTLTIGVRGILAVCRVRAVDTFFHAVSHGFYCSAVSAEHAVTGWARGAVSGARVRVYSVAAGSA